MGRGSVLTWLLLPLLALSLSACGSFRPPSEREVLLEYRVVPGDTLYSIAWRYGYDYRELAAWNRIKAPYSIYVGQKLKIIAPFQREPRAPKRVASVPQSPQPSATPRPAVKKPPVAAAPQGTKRPTAATATTRSNRPPLEKPPTRTDTAPIVWRWPTEGKLVHRYDPAAGRKGLDIGGKRGQPVVAAASGVVVYSGEGLIGYGKLVIIKHNDTYLSAYGHNSRLLVKEGQQVKQGMRIAELGGTRKEGNILHFEIRREGKPIDPMRYLPGR